MTKSAPLSYEIFNKRNDQGIGFTAVARVTCAKCFSRLDVGFGSRGAHPDTVADKAMRLGWIFDKNNARKNLCPACNYGWSHKENVTVENKHEKPTLAASRTMTAEDRAKIREFLDGHYDERRKCLLDGHTDKSIGEKLEMPWAWIKDIRELAYGPIEVSPEMMELREDMDGLKKSIAEINAAAASLHGKLAAAYTKLARLEGK